MAEIKRFDKEFITRTKELLVNYDGEYKLTNLLNCCLGLIVLPFEFMSRGNFMNWNEDVNELKHINFKLIRFEPVRDRRTGELYPKTIGVFLRKLRNGITHQRIEPINEGGNFVGVKIKTSENDLEVEFTRNQLESLCFYICDRYLINFPE